MSGPLGVSLHILHPGTLDTVHDILHHIIQTMDDTLGWLDAGEEVTVASQEYVITLVVWADDWTQLGEG